MNPRFDKNGNEVFTGSPETVNDQLIVQRHHPLYTAREKVKIRASHSGVYKSLGS